MYHPNFYPNVSLKRNHTHLRMTDVLYILGSTRSGTSALRNGLGNTRYRGFGEGHLVPILDDIVRAVRTHRIDGLGARTPGNGLFELRESVLIRHLFHGYENYLATVLESQSVMDKTPTITPIRLAPDLNRFHQTPYFIHCARRHVDNIQSKLKKFPDRTVQQHCQEWAACNATWLDVKEHLDGNYLAFDFYELVTDQEGTSRRIGEYLGLDEGEIAALAEYLISQRPQGATDRDLTQFLKLSEMEWSAQEKEDFVEICGPVGERLGYGLEDYYATPQQPAVTDPRED